MTALFSRQALPLGQKCVIPSCEEVAIARSEVAREIGSS